MPSVLTLLGLCLLLVSGCTGTSPHSPQDAPVTSVRLAQVRAAAATFSGIRIRWGGTITRIENLPQTTRLEVVARRLYDSGRPVDEDRSEGRFIAHIDHFLDPSIYAYGRSITVVGLIAGMEERTIDQMTYHYPLVQVESYHLWPLAEPYDYPPPYYYDPFFYDPWYPFRYPYPYYYPRHRH